MRVERRDHSVDVRSLHESDWLQRRGTIALGPDVPCLIGKKNLSGSDESVQHWPLPG
jgi:hypothetical protein